jgi:hypothetical protein
VLDYTVQENAEAIGVLVAIGMTNTKEHLMNDPILVK